MLELQGVHRVFKGEQGASVAALRDVSIRIETGEYVCITGPSGAGKTTLMNILGCLDQPSSGTYRVAGREVQKFRPDELASLRRLFGFIFQSYNLLDGATAVENVEIPGIYAGMSRRMRTRRAQELLAKAGLSDRTGNLSGELSGGEQQRVALARALMNNGRVILVDEPTGALDQDSGDQVMQALEELAALGHTVIVISHDSKIAARARRRIELQNGRVVEDSGPSKVASLPPEYQPTGAAKGMTRIGAALDTLRIAFRTALRHRSRTILPSCCIAIAVCLGSVTPSVGQGIYRYVFDRVNEMGMDAMLILGNAFASPSFAGLSSDDARAIADEVPNIRAVSPDIFRHGITVRRGQMTAQMSVRGFVDRGRKEDRGQVSGYWLQAGDFLTDEDDDNLEQVAVLGATALPRLFPPGTNAIRQTIMIENVPFRVKGVFKHRGGILAGDYSEEDRMEAEDNANNWVYAPYKTVSSLLFAPRALNSIVVFVHDPDQMADTATAIRDLGIRRYGEEVFGIEYPQDLLESTEPLRRRLLLVLGTIAGIALLAGNTSVMIAMLTSVRVRRREIGIRMAVGAKRRNILSQFLCEAMVVSLAGGTAGLLLALGLLATLHQFGVPVVLSIWFLAIPLACALASGLLSGIVPARRAARLNPMTALAAE